MLAKIKELLDLRDDDKDSEITLCIEMLCETILDICNLKKLNKALENFIVSKVYTIMRSKLTDSSQEQSQSNIASVSRGDTTITYNTSNSTRVLVNSSDIALSDSELDFIKNFKDRKLRCF